MAHRSESYFIDTILRDFPFPKVYFHERVDKSTKNHDAKLSTANSASAPMVVADGKFPLGRNARDLDGKRFSDLSEATQEAFSGGVPFRLT